MSQIAIVNSSTVVTDADGMIITTALNTLLPQFCKDWDLPKYTAVYVGKGKQTSIPLKVFLLDTADVDGALGYHYEANNIPYGKCFAQTILDYGGVMLYSTDPTVQTFAQVVSHEVFELLGDHNANTWWDVGDGQTLYAAEACDVVQGNIVLVNVLSKNKIPVSILKNQYKPVIKTTVTKVGMSDWILPAWGDPQDTRGPFNHMRTLTAPFTLDSGGYAIQITGGSAGQIFAMKFGDKVTDKQKELYAARSRICKRIKKTT
jgi:hypothetical protein